MTMPLTSSELHEWTRSYFNNIFSGGLGPCTVSEENLGDALRLQASSLTDDEPLRKLSEFNDLLGLSPEEAGCYLRKMAALDAMTKQVEAFQEENQISGVIELRVEFKPLDLSIVMLKQGCYLKLIGDDSSRLKQDVQNVARAFMDMANGPGRNWLRYREVKTLLDDGQLAYRFTRDSWDPIEKSIAIASSCNISTTIGLDLGIGCKDAIELQLREDELNEENSSWLLVDPSCEDELNDPELYWLCGGSSGTAS